MSYTTNKQVNYQELRDRELPLPNFNQDYARVLLVGTTGAGKTTLLRQLIGSDPKKDRFPSTSPNKTTVSDIEVICSEGEYEAVVTFFDLREVRLHIEDCIMSSVTAKVKGLDEFTVAQRLLEHTEQRFRFFYVLGDYNDELEDEEDYFEDEEDFQEMKENEQYVSSDERKKLRSVIQGYLAQITKLAEFKETVKDKLGKELGLNNDVSSIEDKLALDELSDEELRKSRDFQKLVDEIQDEIAERFNYLNVGSIELSDEEWPIMWKFRTENRDVFIETVRRFSSNYAPFFGKLLTPLVQGIRVKGPFKPNWSTNVPRLVFIDGQGIGHTVNATTSLPSQTSRKFETSDVVILVDSSKQPMQAASLSVLRSLAASGHISKVRICFSHLDELKGDNLRTLKSRENHVKASLNQAVAHIIDTLGQEAAYKLDDLFSERSYFLSNLDQVLGEKDKPTTRQLNELIGVLERSIFVDTESNAIPFYDETNIVFAIQIANQKFHELWDARLGYSPMTDEPKQHWAKVKALSRRLAYNFGDGEYNGMRPVSELKDRLMENIRLFLSRPNRWIPGTVTEDEKLITVEKISREIHSQLLDFSSKQVLINQLNNWKLAYELKGKSSSGKRADAIKAIYTRAAPTLEEVYKENYNEFLLNLRQIVKNVILAKGGKLIPPSEGQ